MTDASALLSAAFVDAVRTALLVLVCVLAIAGTVIFYGSGSAPLTADEQRIAGRWSDGSVDLELGQTGRYALVVGSAGELECGKWRVADGTLQMRAKQSAGIKSTLLMTQPGFRAGTFSFEEGKVDLRLQAALPGERSRPENWTLAPAAAGLLERCP